MIKKILNIIFIAVLTSLLFGMTACHSDEPADNKTGEGRLILLYAVASNNLASNLTYDMREIINVAPQLDLKNNCVLAYTVNISGECKLQRLEYDKSTNKYVFNTIKTYPKTPLSIEKERMEEVFSDVSENFDYPYKGLILWSHGTGWIPWFPPQSDNGKMSKRRTFGLDYYDGVGYQCNINTLAEAIPAGVFDYIWFDCCYMANIETLYQLRDKTQKIVGYVTEIWNDGMPYDATMPYLLKADADLAGAAFALFTYYDSQYAAVTVSVTDTSELEYLAEVSNRLLKEGTPPQYLSGIQNYSRLKDQPFFDMGQLMESYKNVSAETMADFKDAINKAVTYKLTSEIDFNGRLMDVERYSGLSMHYYEDNGTTQEEFYSTLDWFKATRD